MGNSEIHLPQLIAETFGGSRSNARRMMTQGGIKLNGSPLKEMDFDAPDLNGELQIGTRRRVVLVDGEVKADA